MRLGRSGLEVKHAMSDNDFMTKREFIKQLDALTPEQVERLLPYLQADVAAVDKLDELKEHIDAGRRSALESPSLDTHEAIDRARKSL